jgi:hypothetical protein
MADINLWPYGVLFLFAVAFVIVIAAAAFTDRTPRL